MCSKQLDLIVDNEVVSVLRERVRELEVDCDYYRGLNRRWLEAHLALSDWSSERAPNVLEA